MERRDHVGRILDQWAVERPDLDCSPMGVVGRLHRIGLTLDAELRPVFASAGLGDGEFDVLATLRRAGAPFELTPGALGASMMVSSGAVTKRVDRLVAAGYVARSVSREDARSRLIRLTPDGRALVDDLVAHHVANEERLLAGLSGEERIVLAGLLERWALALED